MADRDTHDKQMVCVLLQTQLHVTDRPVRNWSPSFKDAGYTYYTANIDFMAVLSAT